MNATIDWSKIAARTAKKVERAAERLNYEPATGVQTVLRCEGIIVPGLHAHLNAVSKYPYPTWEIETGQVAIVGIPEHLWRIEQQEYVN